jgi:hypothetical protein
VDGNVFISYRRGDSAGYAGRVSDSLRARLGSQVNVFLDVEDIPPGEDFGEAVQSAVRRSGTLLVVIGPRWISVMDEAGRRRLDDPTDLVRLEVMAALSHGVHIIPVLVQGAKMPAASDLPAELASLARREAVELSDERWQFDVGRLAAAIRPVQTGLWNKRPVVLTGAAVVLVVAVAVGTFLIVDRPPGTSTRSNGPSASLSMLLFSDTMVPPSPNWPTRGLNGTSSHCQSGPLADGYRIKVTGRDYFCSATVNFDPNIGQLEDTAIETTVRFTDKTLPGDVRGGPGTAGLRCRSRGSDSSGDGYSFGIGPTGYYQLDRYVDGQQQKLDQGVDSALNAAGDSPIHLRLECLGKPGASTTIRLLHDDAEIASFVDPVGLAAGAPGLEVASFGEPAFGAAFTDFRVFGQG